MATDINALSILATLISNNYNTANTDSKSAEIDKIYVYPKSFDMTKDWVLLYGDGTSMEAVGIGNDNLANINESIKIDIRISGDNDIHARKVLTEVRRILHSKRKNPHANFQELNPFNDMVDLSDRSRKIYRYILKVNLKEGCRDMTA